MRNSSSLAFNYLGLSKSIRAQSTARQYQSGQTIFDQGDAADAIFYIQDGNAKLTVVSKGGKKAVIAILRCGDFFGESCMTSRALRTSSATAIRESTIIRVKRADIIRILHHEPAFAKLFTSHLLFRIGRIEEDLADQVCNSSEKRLARLLLILADFGKQPELPAGVPKVDQETLAEMVGTTRSRISFFMNRFRAKGYIDYNGGLHVHEALQTFLFEG